MNLHKIKKGDYITLHDETRTYKVPVVRETIGFLEVDVSSVYNKKTMMFSRAKSTLRGSKDYFPYISA